MTRAPAPADEVNQPAHYTAGPPCPHCGEIIECITITENHGFLTGNAMKYLWRAGLKGVALTDLLKARWYVDRAIQVEKARSATERAATAPHAASTPADTRQPTPGVYERIDCCDAPVTVERWVPNDYTALHRSMIGPDDPDGPGLFPSGWTPEKGQPPAGETERG